MPSRSIDSAFQNWCRRKDVQRFAELYVATSVLAKRFRLNSGAFARYLKESGTPLLVVPLSDKGEGPRIFPPQGCRSADPDS